MMRCLLACARGADWFAKCAIGIVLFTPLISLAVVVGLVEWSIKN